MPEENEKTVPLHLKIYFLVKLWKKKGEKRFGAPGTRCKQ